MIYVSLRSFLKKFDDYNKKEQAMILLAVEKIKNYLETNNAAYGLRVKQLSPRIYEARINIHLRIAYFRENDVVKFFCLGNHADISHCLNNIARVS